MNSFAFHPEFFHPILRAIDDDLDLNDFQRLLHELGPDVDINFVEKGYSPLYFCLYARKYHFLDCLLAVPGVDLNKLSKRRTPLYIAVVRTNVDAVLKLLERGADPDIQCTSKNVTPLHVACAGGLCEVAQLLLTFGSSPNALSSVGSPLHVCAERDHTVIAKLLLDSGLCDVNAATPSDGETALIIACRRKHMKFVDLLLQHSNVDLTVRDHTMGHTCLHAVCNGVERKTQHFVDVISQRLLEREPRLIAMRSTVTREVPSHSASFRLLKSLRDAYVKMRPHELAWTDQFTDAQLVTTDGLLIRNVHRCILVARCDYFSGNEVILVDDVVPRYTVPITIEKASVLECFLSFLYTGRVPLVNKDPALHADFMDFATAVGLRDRLKQGLRTDLRALFHSGRFSDCTVVVRESEESTASAPETIAANSPIPVHRIVLMNSSKVLSNLVSGGWRESSAKEIVLHGNVAAIRAVLEMCYSGAYAELLDSFQQDPNALVALFEIAHMFEMESLSRRCEIFLVDHFLDSYAVELFVIAKRFDALLLRESAFDAIVEIDKLSSEQLIAEGLDQEDIYAINQRRAFLKQKQNA